MHKKGRMMIFVALCILCVLVMTVEAMAASNIRAMKTVIGRIEQGSIAMIGEMPLIPDDCSGFSLSYHPDLPEEILNGLFSDLSRPENTEMHDGMIIWSLDESTAGLIFDNAYAVSIGPDGSILWFVYFPSHTFIFIQHDKTLVLASQSDNRGAADTDGNLKSVLNYKMNINSEPVEGEVRWSPDCRYLFFNDTDRWLGTKMMLDDPYLIDTQTGEIFLIENSGYPKNPSNGNFQCILNGFFSMDGNSFYWYCRTYTPGIPPAHSLMRYNLQNGSNEMVCELNGSVKDFCEIKPGCWLLLETSGDGMNLIRMSVSANGVEKDTEYLSMPSGSCSFLPVVREKVLLAVTPLPSSGTYLLPLEWDTPAISSAWYKLGSLAETQLHELSMDEIEKELHDVSERNRKGISTQTYINAAKINDAAAIIGIPNLLLTVEIRESVPESWGGGFHYFSGQVILNTETLSIYPIQTASTDVPQDSFIDGNRFLIKNYGQDVVGLYSVETLPDVLFLNGETYISPFGTFICRNESDPLILTSVTLKNRECSANINAVEDRYEVSFHIVDHPEPESVSKVFLVPEALTVNRWNEITAMISKKNQKKLSGLYTKIIPDELEKRENKDDLLACYPVAATETLYVLKSDIKSTNLAMAEAILSAAGYTEDDYNHDMELAVRPQSRNVVFEKNGKDSSFTVSYSFSASDPILLSGNFRALALAGLCDRIASSVMENYIMGDPLPIESVILNKYVISNTVFHISLEHSEATENSLEFFLIVKID